MSSLSDTIAEHSLLGSLLGLHICHSENILNAHLVEYLVDLGIHSSSNFFSSSALLGALKHRLGGILLPSVYEQQMNKRL
jgi:hypothetical protein